MRIALWFGAAVIFVCAGLAQTPSPAGKWRWGAGSSSVELEAGGTGRDSSGHTVRWTARDAASRTYVLQWSHGYTDTVTLSSDGNSLSAVNNAGLRFTAQRVSEAAAGRGAAIAGEWNWGAGGGTVEIRASGAGRDPRGNTLRWTLRDAAARVYILAWSHGYTDTATLSADGNTINAVNNQGLRFTATRKTGAVETPVDLNGIWTGGLHIWQDGARVLATASWKRDDGKYVIWYAEGTINGRAVDLAVHYSPMTHGPVPVWRGTFAVSPDGNTIDAVYTLSGAAPDRRRYVRER